MNRYRTEDNGKVYSNLSKKYLKPGKDNKGYLRVSLKTDNGYKTKKVHRLVATEFIPNPMNKPMVNHINGIKTDNRVSNLEWVTAKENTKHAIDNGLFVFMTSEKSTNKTIKRGVLNGQSLLNETDVLYIREHFKPRVVTRKMLAKRFNVTENCIKDVVLRKSWKHI